MEQKDLAHLQAQSLLTVGATVSYFRKNAGCSSAAPIQRALTLGLVTSPRRASGNLSLKLEHLTCHLGGFDSFRRSRLARGRVRHKQNLLLQPIGMCAIPPLRDETSLCNIIRDPKGSLRQGAPVVSNIALLILGIRRKCFGTKFAEASQSCHECTSV